MKLPGLFSAAAVVVAILAMCVFLSYTSHVFEWSQDLSKNRNLTSAKPAPIGVSSTSFKEADSADLPSPDAKTASSFAHARVIIVPSDLAQVMEGFGASGAWWAESIGFWPSEKRAEIMALLFGTRGIGLTIYRYNIGAGSGDEIPDPWRRTQTFEVSPGKYDWTRDTGAMRVLLEACRRGVQRVTLFANSPPKRMTKSGRAFALRETGLSNLREDMYGDYAAYLADIVDHMKNQLGVPVFAVSPINEPQWGWDQNHQEGCHYEPDEMSRLVEKVLITLRGRDLDVRVMAAERARWEPLNDIIGYDPNNSPVYVDTLFANAYIDKNMDSYSLHSYWAQPGDKRAFAKYFFSMYPGKKLHMSEWCEMKEGRDYGMDSALRLAHVITEDFVLGGVSSWQYWIAVSKYDWRDGLIYLNDSEETFQTTKRLWALGNFSKFIRPGFTRVSAFSDSPSLEVVAAKDAGNNVVVVVVTNAGDRGVQATLSLDGMGSRIRYDAWETSEQRDLEKTAQDRAGRQQVFLPQSITTLVIRETQAGSRE